MVLQQWADEEKESESGQFLLLFSSLLLSTHWGTISSGGISMLSPLFKNLSLSLSWEVVGGIVIKIGP